MKFIFLFLAALFFTSCSVITCATESSKGHEALANKDFELAEKHYLKARDALDGFLANEGLANTYFFQGQPEKAWKYLHKSVYMNPNRLVSVTNFVNQYWALNEVHKIDEWGYTPFEITELLGQPDRVEKHGKETYLIYGLVLMCFHEDHLSNHYWIFKPQVIPLSPAESVLDYLPIWTK